MLKVNEYFDGKVKSIALNNAAGQATVGVMAVGDYEFSTGSREEMQVISGCLQVSLPGETGVQTFTQGQGFEVPANSRFQVSATEETAYICYYR